MGADLIIYYFSVDVDYDYKQGKENMLSAVEKLTDDDEDAIVDYYDHVYGERYDEVDSIDLESAKGEFVSVIKEMFEAIERDYRDLSWIMHKGERIWVSGGMSYGDMPTETSSNIMKFTELPQKILDAGMIDQAHLHPRNLDTKEKLLKRLESLRYDVAENIREGQTAVSCSVDPDTGKQNYDDDDDICNYFDAILDRIDDAIERVRGADEKGKYVGGIK